MINQPEVAVIGFWNASPHLEISLEIALRKAIEGKKHVLFCHWGSRMPFVECYQKPPLGNLPREVLAHQVTSHLLQWCFDLPIATTSYVIEHEWLQSATKLKRLTYKHGLLGQALYANLIDLTKQTTPSILGREALLAAMANSYISSYESTLHVLETNPCIEQIVTFNGRHICYAAVYDACSSKGVPVLFHERGGDDSRYSLWPTKVHSIESLQRYLDEAWHSKQVSDAMALVCAREKLKRRINSLESGRACDNARYFLSSAGAGGDHNYFDLVYFASCTDELDCLADRHSLCPPGAWTDQRMAVLDLLRSIRVISSNIRLVLRLHPNLASKSSAMRAEWDIVREQKNHDFLIVEPESEVSSYELLRRARMIFVYHSTIGAEALAMGMTVFAMSACAYDNIEGCVAIDCQDKLIHHIRARHERGSPVPKCPRIGMSGLRHLYSFEAMGSEFKYCWPRMRFDSLVNPSLYRLGSAPL